jgi:hypothetical protein
MSIAIATLAACAALVAAVLRAVVATATVPVRRRR